MALQKVLDNLKNSLSFKSNTAPGDIILVGTQAGLFYGVVQDIANNPKKNWYNLHFKLLAIPPTDVTWILRIPQMNGEIFTMDEEEHFVISVDVNPTEKRPEEQEEEKPAPPKLRIIRDDETK